MGCFFYVSALYTFVMFFERFAFFFLSTSISCHGMVFLCICIVYVRYVFFESCSFLCHTNRHLLSTFVTCHGMVFLSFCIVYVRYTF